MPLALINDRHARRVPPAMNEKVLTCKGIPEHDDEGRGRRKPRSFQNTWRVTDGGWQVTDGGWRVTIWTYGLHQTEEKKFVKLSKLRKSGHSGCIRLRIQHSWWNRKGHNVQVWLTTEHSSRFFSH